MFRLAIIGLLSVVLSACAGPFWWGPGGGPGGGGPGGGGGGPQMQLMGGAHPGP